MWNTEKDFEDASTIFGYAINGSVWVLQHLS